MFGRWDKSGNGVMNKAYLQNMPQTDVLLAAAWHTLDESRMVGALQHFPPSPARPLHAPLAAPAASRAIACAPPSDLVSAGCAAPAQLPVAPLRCASRLAVGCDKRPSLRSRCPCPCCSQGTFWSERVMMPVPAALRDQVFLKLRAQLQNGIMRVGRDARFIANVLPPLNP